MSDIKKKGSRMEILPKSERLGNVLPAENGDEVVTLGQLQRLGINTSGYKIFRCVLTQSSTGAPSVVVIDNTFTSVPAITYGDIGEYLVTLSEAFTTNKTFVMPSGTVKGTFGYALTSTSVITLSTTDTAFASANDILQDNSLEIIVYN